MLMKKQITKINTLRKGYFHASIGKSQLLKLISENEVFARSIAPAVEPLPE